MDFKQAKRVTSTWTQKLNDPMREIEAIQKVLTNGGFNDDMLWKMLPPESKAKVVNALQNRLDAQMTKLEEFITKLQAALEV